MIPPEAKKVFQGQSFSVWQWEQTLFDGKVKTFEQLKRLNSANIIATTADKVIVLEQVQPNLPPFISLPGGRCEEGEDGLATAKRELLEETRYVSYDEFLDVANRPNFHDINITIECLRAEVDSQLNKNLKSLFFHKNGAKN